MKLCFVKIAPVWGGISLWYRCTHSAQNFGRWNVRIVLLNNCVNLFVLVPHGVVARVSQLIYILIVRAYRTYIPGITVWWLSPGGGIVD